jgi:hypothetical protein
MVVPRRLSTWRRSQLSKHHPQAHADLGDADDARQNGVARKGLENAIPGRGPAAPPRDVFRGSYGSDEAIAYRHHSGHLHGSTPDHIRHVTSSVDGLCGPPR